MLTKEKERLYRNAGLTLSPLVHRNKLDVGRVISDNS